MKYLALVYYNEQAVNEKPQKEWDAMNRECIHCVQKLTEQGHYLDGAPLQSIETATTVRVRDGKCLVTDGPFAETKEQLAGYYLLNARDMNEAIRLVEEIPPAKYGCIEVRPVRELLSENNIH